MAKRLRAMGQEAYRNGFKVTLHESVLQRPLSWKKPQTIFVNSMSDLFHEAVPLSFIQQVFDVMQSATWHRFQVLTKRADRLLDLAGKVPWPCNVWAGVSVENAQFKWRISRLQQVQAAVRFLSVEPLLGPLGKIDLAGIDWVIVGGESGPRARPVREDWVTEVRDQCLQAHVAFFFKQWGGTQKKLTGRQLEGRTWDGMPADPCSDLGRAVS